MAHFFDAAPNAIQARLAFPKATRALALALFQQLNAAAQEAEDAGFEMDGLDILDGLNDLALKEEHFLSPVEQEVE